MPKNPGHQVDATVMVFFRQRFCNLSCMLDREVHFLYDC